MDFNLIYRTRGQFWVNYLECQNSCEQESSEDADFCNSHLQQHIGLSILFPRQGKRFLTLSWSETISISGPMIFLQVYSNWRCQIKLYVCSNLLALKQDLFQKKWYNNEWRGKCMDWKWYWEKNISPSSKPLPVLTLEFSNGMLRVTSSGMRHYTLISSIYYSIGRVIPRVETSRHKIREEKEKEIHVWRRYSYVARPRSREVDGVSMVEPLQVSKAFCTFVLMERVEEFLLFE